MVKTRRSAPTAGLGYRKIDRDHRILAGIIDQLETANRAPGPSGASQPLMIELASYVDSHFDNEEELMASSGYPDAAAHTAEHNKMRRDVRELADAICAGQPGAAERAVTMARSWFEEHTTGTDRELAHHLRRFDADKKDAQEETVQPVL